MTNINYDKIRHALQIFADTAIEGEVVFLDSETGQIHKGKVPQREARVVAINELKQTLSRKQRRVKASKERSR